MLSTMRAKQRLQHLPLGKRRQRRIRPEYGTLLPSVLNTGQSQKPWEPGKLEC